MKNLQIALNFIIWTIIFPIRIIYTLITNILPTTLETLAHLFGADIELTNNPVFYLGISMFCIGSAINLYKRINNTQL